MFNKFKLAIAALALMVTSVAQSKNSEDSIFMPSHNFGSCMIKPSNYYLINRNLVNAVFVKDNTVTIQLLGIKYSVTSITLTFPSHEHARNWMDNSFPKLPCLR